MEKLLPVLLSASLLTACGGSGGDSSPQPSTPAPVPAPVPAPNEAPTISGTFTLNAKAAQSNKIVLNTADKENDQLSFSMANKPDWVSFNLTGNQLELDFQPSFFDIDDYQLKLRISDGKDATEYDFNLVVEDNREKWQEIDMTEAETVGIWSNTAEDIRFAFLSNETGFYSKNSDSKVFSWSAPDTVDMRVYNPGCFQAHCQQQDFFEMSVVAKEQNRIRVSILDNNNRQTVVNLTKEQNSASQNKYYIAMAERGYYNATTFAPETQKIKTRVNLSALFLGNDTLYHEGFNLEADVSFDNGVYRANNQTPILLPRKVVAGFHNNASGRSDQLTFNAFADNITVTVSASGLLMTSADISLELTSNLSPYSASDYPQLPTTIPTKKASNLLQAAPKAAKPVQLKAGESYSGLLITEDRKLGDINYDFGAPVWKILDDNQGQVNLSAVGINKSESRNFTWQLNNQVLTIILDGIESQHEFVDLPNNRLGLTLSFKLDDGDINTNIYSFSQITEQRFSPEQYTGVFKHSMFSVFENDGIATVLRENNRGRYYVSLDGLDNIDFINNHWQYQEDGSVSIINNYSCRDLANYDQCLALTLNDPELGTLVRNLKLLSISGDTYKFQYSLFSKPRNGNQYASQSIRYFTKMTK